MRIVDNGDTTERGNRWKIVTQTEKPPKSTHRGGVGTHSRYTPRHNGKVERNHRKDNEYFYTTHKFYSFEDFRKQLAVHSKKCNNFPMRPLAGKSPNEYLNYFLSTGEVF